MEPTTPRAIRDNARESGPLRDAVRADSPGHGHTRNVTFSGLSVYGTESSALNGVLWPGQVLIYRTGRDLGGVSRRAARLRSLR